MRTTQLRQTKPSRHRAVAVFKNGKEGHITMGPHYAWVAEHYDSAFHALYGEKSEVNQTEEIKEVQIQKWEGTESDGRWISVKTTKVPQPVSLPIAIRRAVSP